MGLRIPRSPCCRRTVGVIYIALVLFCFLIYVNPASNVGLGSINKVYDNLNKMSAVRPVSGNKQGNLMTMMSLDGLIFGIINIIGNCARPRSFGARPTRGDCDAFGHCGDALAPFCEAFSRRVCPTFSPPCCSLSRHRVC